MAAAAGCKGGGDGAAARSAADSPAHEAGSIHVEQEGQHAEEPDAAQPAPKRASSSAGTYRKLAAFAALASAAARAGGSGGLEDVCRETSLLHGYCLGVDGVGTAPSNRCSGDALVSTGSIDATRSACSSRCEIGAVCGSRFTAASAVRTRLVTCRLSHIPPSLRPAALEHFFGADGIDIDIVPLSSDHGTACTDAAAADAATSAELPVGPPAALSVAFASEGGVSAASWPAPGGSDGDALRAAMVSTEMRASSCPAADAAAAAAADAAAAAAGAGLGSGPGAGAGAGAVRSGAACDDIPATATSAERLALQLDILKASAARLPPRGRTAPQSPALAVGIVGLNRFSDETPSTSRGGGGSGSSAALDASPRRCIHQALTCASSDLRVGLSRNATGSLTIKPVRFAGSAAEWHPSETRARMHNIISMFERRGGELLSRRGALARNPMVSSSPSNLPNDAAVYDGGFEDL